MKKAFIIFLSLLCLNSCLEDIEPVSNITGDIRGIVREASTNSAISDVIFHTIPWTNTDTSNFAGLFEFFDLNENEYFIFAQKAGYKTSKQKITINPGEVKEVVFNLEKILEVNSPPSRPNLLYPENGLTQVRDSLLLTWSRSIDADEDSVFYDVYLDKNPTPFTRVYSSIRDTFCVIKNLEASSSYYWRIIAFDGENYSLPSSIRRFNTESNIFYNVMPPEGKLPYPHHNPVYTIDEYNTMMEELWIIDNFGDYIAKEPASESRLSTGLTIHAGNNAEIFAVTDGIVRVKNSYDPENTFIVIEDISKPGYAWKYEGLENFRFNIGDVVKQGSQIGQLSSHSNGFYTLCRIKKSPEMSWGRQEWNYMDPLEKFVFSDTQKPIINRSFYFLYNNTPIRLVRPNAPNTFYVYGEVDIVLNVRDNSEYAQAKRQSEEHFDNNISITKIEYSLTNSTGETILYDSFNFKELELTGYEVFDIYQSHNLIPPIEDDTVTNVLLNKYYVLTNCKRVNGELIINPDFSLDCQEVDENGEWVIPRGEFLLKARIYDIMNNYTEKFCYIIVL